MIVHTFYNVKLRRFTCKEKQNFNLVCHDKLASSRSFPFMIIGLFWKWRGRDYKSCFPRQQKKGKQSFSDVKHKKTFWLNDSTTKPRVHFIVLLSKRRTLHKKRWRKHGDKMWMRKRRHSIQSRWKKLCKKVNSGKR